VTRSGGPKAETIPEPVTIETVAAPDAIRVLRSHPAFRNAAQAFARAALAGLEEADPETRWMIADLGRTSLYIIALVLDGLPGGFTVATLKATAATYAIASAGRVTAFVDRCLRTGSLALSPGSEPWTRRRLRPTSAFVQPLGRMLAARMRAVSPLASELEAAAAKLGSDAAVATAITEGVRVSTSMHGQDLGWLQPLMFFMGRDGGMRFVEYLVAQQSEPRAGLLAPVKVNKSQAARACWVSRRHLDTLIVDGAAADLLKVDPSGTIEMAPAVGEALEGYYAVHVRGFRLMAQKLRQACVSPA
jgi:hypothetical protein